MSATQNRAENEPDALEIWTPLMGLRCEVSLDLEIPEFRVRDLLQLKGGSILSTNWGANRDIPVQVNGRLLAWAEFETSSENLAVRLTEFVWEQQQR